VHLDFISSTIVLKLSCGSLILVDNYIKAFIPYSSSFALPNLTNLDLSSASV